MKFNLFSNVHKIGEGASIKYRSLSIEDYQRLVKVFGESFSSGKSEEEKGFAVAGSEKFREIGKELIEKYCYDLEGIVLETEQGSRNATVQDLFDYGIFQGIVIGIVSALLQGSELSNKESLEVKK